jgi:hypothetical protein
MFILTTLSFTLATIYWAVWMAAVTIQIHWTFVKNIGMDLVDRKALSDAAITTLNLIQFYLRPFMVL